ncbi:MAG: fibronectin type III domain-containing protein [Treponema sp.]|nr:fibronectin type III domain-containing protein [Treponema sp.]
MKKSAKLALFFSVMFTLVSCQGFLQSESVKNEIYSVIEYNNAPSYKIKFDSEKNRGTFKAPTGIETQKKVTDSFTVSFAPANDYDFLYWKIMDAATKTEYPNGEYLTLESVTNDTTTCKFTKAPQNGIQLTLFAVVAKRPRIISKTPQPDSVTYRDTRIRVVFDKPMDEGSIYFDEKDMDSLEHQLGITSQDYLNAGTTANPKYYCYFYNGKKYYKNIQIVNTNAPDTSILEYFGVPYFEDPTTLIIPPDKYTQVPANTTLTVTLEAGFSYSYNYSAAIEKKLMLKEDEIWLFSVNSDTDKDAPSGSETITDSKGNEISKDSSNPTTLYQQKLKMYVDVKDDGSRPSNTFKILFTNTDNDKIEPVTIPYGSFNSSKTQAYLGTSSQKFEYRFTGIPDGTYKMNFIYYDNNGNPSEPKNDFYIKIDSTPPTVTDILFNTYSGDATSTANDKTALKFTYTCEDTDFEKVTATWHSADGSEPQDTKTYQKTETNFIIPNLTFGKLYTVDLEFFKSNGNSYKYTQNVRATYDYVRDFEITGKNINQKAEVTLSWDKPKGEFDKYIIGYKKASNTSNNYDKEYEVDNSETEYTIPVSLDLNTKYVFRISTYSGGSSTGYSKEFTTPIHTIGIDNFNISKNGNSSNSTIYLEVSSTVINSNYNYTVVMYYSDQEFELTDVTQENIQSGRLKYVSLSRKYYGGYYYHTEYDATNTEIADNKYFNFGKTYYFLIGITNETKTDTQWSDIKSFTIAYTVKNLKIQTLMGNVKTPIVSSKNAYITWDYPTGVIFNIVDSVQVFVNESTQPVWSINNSCVEESPKLFIENLNPDSENTIEVRLTFNKVTTSQFLTIKTLKEIPDFKIDHARYTSSSHTYVYTTFTWNSPSDEIDRYVFMCKRTSPTADTTFYYTNREPDYPYVPSSNPLSLYGNDGWTEGIEGTNTTEFELQEYINNDYRIPIQVNHSYEIFVTGYKLDDNNKPVAVVSELIPLSFN